MGTQQRWPGIFCFAFLLLWSSEGLTATSEKAADKVICDAECVAIGQWQFSVGVGAGLRLNPLTEGDDTPLIILPEVSYYGRRFFLRNFEVGFTLVETEQHQLNLVATPSYDQMYFNRWDPLNLTFAGGSSPISAAPIGYTSINISSPRYTDPILGEDPIDAAPPSAPSDDMGGGEQVSDGPSLAVTGSISANVQIELNGAIITTSTDLVGNEGNLIRVSISDDALIINGVSPSDELYLLGDETVDFTGLSGDLDSTTKDFTGAQRIRVNAGQDTFTVSADPLPAPSGVKVPFDAVSKRRLSGLAGVEYSYNLPRMSLHLQALKDFTNVHHGEEYRAAVIFPFTFSSHQLALTLGVNHKSQKVLDYYYGIDAAEADSADWLYQVSAAGTETLARIDWQKPIGDQWTLRAKVQYLGLPTQMTRSPLVAEDYVLSVFLGGVYHF